MPAVQKAAARAAASHAKGSAKGKGKRKAESDPDSGEGVWDSMLLPCCITALARKGRQGEREKEDHDSLLIQGSVVGK